MNSDRAGRLALGCVLTLLIALPEGAARTVAQTPSRASAAIVPADPADDDDVPSQDLRAGGDENKRYFLIGPKEKAKPPADGWKLLIVMPGGPGNAEFKPFVTNILRNALSKEYVVAEPVSVLWTPEQETVWPTRLSTAKKMKFTTEEFVEAVIADVAKRQKIDPKFVFTLSWSSSGPAAYLISLEEKTRVTGSYVAMSVFQPKLLPPLGHAKGRAFFIDHSPEDKVCAFKMAEEARDALEKQGAKVEFSTYEGGHGWNGDVFGRIRKGVAFLEKNHAAPPPR